jgi:hypothetical protein
MEKKEPLGFKTPSMQIQEEYEEILKQLKKKEANWKKILTDLLDNSDDFFKRTDDVVKRIKSKKEITHEDHRKLEYRVLNAGQYLIRIMVAGLGKELTECAVRIAAVEKELKDLRRGIK